MQDVIVISETKQSFLGENYYKCGEYFQRSGVRLHRKVWEHHNGEIPKGFHVHHIDHNKSNNSHRNLELVHGSAHMSHHQKGHGRKPSEKAHLMANEWHASDAGREWHKQHYENNKHTLHKKITRECSHCGKSHETAKLNGNAFCSNNCKSAYRRKSGVDNIEISCQHCGSTFTANKYGRSRKFCSHKFAFEGYKRKSHTE